MWLDADFEGGKGRHSRSPRLPPAIKEAEEMLSEVSEGQVGIFEEYGGGEFYGYVIKTPERGVYFEPAEGLLLKLRPRTGGGLAILSEEPSACIRGFTAFCKRLRKSR